MKWRRKERASGELPPCVRRGLIHLNQQLIQMARLLQEKTNRFSPTKKKILLLIFLVVFVAQSTVVLVRSIGGDKSSIVITRIKSVAIPTENRTAELTPAEFSNIKRFKTYIDSLNRTAKGIMRRDSLLKQRPHLMDSVEFLINYFLNNQKAKENEK